MNKFLIFSLLLFCGINGANAQFGGIIKSIIEKKREKARNTPHNFIYKKSGEIVKIKKGKEKPASDRDFAYGIDTLFLEDPSIPVGNVFINPKLGTKNIKIIVSNNVEYLSINEIDNRLSIDNPSQRIASYQGVQGFQAQLPDRFGSYNLVLVCGRYPLGENVLQLNLPDAVIIDGEVGDLRGYFTGAKIEKVVFSPKIRKIGKGAFRNCKNLQEVVFPDGCDDVEIDPEAFIGCDALKAIRVPNEKGKDYVNNGFSEALVVDGNAVLNIEIELEKPGTILEKIPIEKLNKITSLSVIGFLDENDMEVLKECINLKKLDLSNAYTTLSEELQKKRKANSAFLRGMIQAMGELSQKRYENGEISTVDNLQVQLFSDLIKGSSDVKNASDGCVIPTGSFSGMDNLETVILPVRASEIESKAFQGCSNLREVILPPYLKRIGTGAFAFCRNLKSIVFPQTLITIGNYDQQHTYGISAAASFVGSGLETIDLSRCSFESNAIDNSWSYRFHCKSLKLVKLPNINYIDVGFGSDLSIICYVPSIVKRLKINEVKEIHFSSIEPPFVEYGFRNCVIYVPKGSLTKYYAKFKGEGNTFIEE